jgi:hypothetical protein
VDGAEVQSPSRIACIRLGNLGMGHVDLWATAPSRQASTELQISFLFPTQPGASPRRSVALAGLPVKLPRKQTEMKTLHRTVVSRAQRSRVRKRVERQLDCEMTSDDMKLQAACIVAAIDG